MNVRIVAATNADIAENIAIRKFRSDLYYRLAETSDAAHAVVIGNHNGTLWMSCNGDYRVVQTMANAHDSLTRELKWYRDEVVAYKVSGQEQPLLTLLEFPRNRS